MATDVEWEVFWLLQSQRDCVNLPKVARHELPWVVVVKAFNPNGVAPRFSRRAATPLGLLTCDALTQGSSCLATLGFEPESRWDSLLEFPMVWRVASMSSARPTEEIRDTVAYFWPVDFRDSVAEIGTGDFADSVCEISVLGNLPDTIRQICSASNAALRLARATAEFFRWVERVFTESNFQANSGVRLCLATNSGVMAGLVI